MDLDKTNGVWTKDYLNVTAIRSEKHSGKDFCELSKIYKISFVKFTKGNRKTLVYFPIFLEHLFESSMTFGEISMCNLFLSLFPKSFISYQTTTIFSLCS